MFALWKISKLDQDVVVRQPFLYSDSNILCLDIYIIVRCEQPYWNVIFMIQRKMKRKAVMAVRKAKTSKHRRSEICRSVRPLQAPPLSLLSNWKPIRRRKLSGNDKNFMVKAIKNPHLANLTCAFDSNLLYFCETHSGSKFRAVTDGDVKVKRRPPCRSIPITVSKPPGVRRRPGRPRLQDKRWPGIAGRPGHYRKSSSLLSFPSSSSSERLKRATRKSSILRATVSNSAQYS